MSAAGSAVRVSEPAGNWRLTLDVWFTELSKIHGVSTVDEPIRRFGGGPAMSTVVECHSCITSAPSTCMVIRCSR